MTVVLHDVAPATLRTCRSLLDAVADAAGVPATLLVVPRYHGAPSDPAFERWLDLAAASGHELALHGFTHRDEGIPTGWIDHLRRRWYTAGEGEFAALSEAEATRRLEAGLLWFATLGWRPAGFVAPAWLMSGGTKKALIAQGFSYTATVSSLVRLPSWRELHSQSVVYSTRAAWRRCMSIAWGAAVSRAQHSQPLLRLELHPPDVEHAGIRRSWMRLLSEAMVDRQAMTVAEAIRYLPDELFKRPSSKSTS